MHNMQVVGAPSVRVVNIGEAIKAAREAAGLNRQADLATLLGVDVSTVNRWESGRSRPDDEMVMAIEGALGLGRGQILIDAGLVDVKIKTRPAPWERLGPEERDLVKRLVQRLLDARR